MFRNVNEFIEDQVRFNTPTGKKVVELRKKAKAAAQREEDKYNSGVKKAARIYTIGTHDYRIYVDALREAADLAIRDIINQYNTTIEVLASQTYGYDRIGSNKYDGHFCDEGWILMW